VHSRQTNPRPYTIPYMVITREVPKLMLRPHHNFEVAFVTKEETGVGNNCQEGK